MNFTKMRNEYFAGRKRTDDDGKLLKAADYTPEEQEMIMRTRIALKHAMHRAKVAHEEWLRMLSEAREGTALDVARLVRKARRERNAARSGVRAADAAYRMAWELPVLRGRTRAAQAASEPRRVMTMDAPGAPMLSSYARRDAQATQALGELRFSRPAEPAKPKRITDLTEHLRRS